MNDTRQQVIKYLIGFALAIILTVLAYNAVVQKWFEGSTLIFVIMGLASLQMMVQLVFFLHVGRGKQGQLNLASFAFTTMTLLILVLGSMWIMHHMNYNMEMTPAQMDQYMLEQSIKGF